MNATIDKQYLKKCQYCGKEITKDMKQQYDSDIIKQNKEATNKFMQDAFKAFTYFINMKILDRNSS